MSTPELAARWNDAGRAYFTEYSARLTRHYGDREDGVDLDVVDPRDEAQGDEVMRAVIALAAEGRRPREVFDPAYAPVMPWIKQHTSQLGFVTILGPDELLVRRGSAWQAGVTFHLRAGRATPVEDVLGISRSRNRDHLVLARAAGLEFRDARAGLDGPAIARLAWPELAILRPRGLSADADAAWSCDDDRWKLEQLEVSDDGMRVVASCYRQGILLGSRHPGEPAWQLLHPDARPPYGDGSEQRAGDMTHVAISRDGARLAWGSQDTGHWLAELTGGEPRWYATVGHISEYPHHACFSDDGRYVALNSCHFYNGGTVAFDWDGNRGKALDAYDVHDEAPLIDDSLRVYAARWLPKPVLSAVIGREAKSDGAFLLAGSGLMRLVNHRGALGLAQGFGSSASSMDFCPESKRLALAAYSGFVHVYDPYEEELPGRIDGYRPRRELARWAMWAHLPDGPICW